MAQIITKGAKELVKAAISKVPAISAEEAIALVGSLDHVFVDLRDGTEQAKSGVIEGAETITAFSKTGQLHPEFQSKFMSLVTSLDTPVFLYCRTGNRTGIIGNALVNQVGFTQITHLEAGIVGWNKDGLPTVTYPSD